MMIDIKLCLMVILNQVRKLTSDIESTPFYEVIIFRYFSYFSCCVLKTCPIELARSFVLKYLAIYNRSMLEYIRMIGFIQYIMM